MTRIIIAALSVAASGLVALAAMAQTYPRPESDRITARSEVESFGDTRAIAPGPEPRTLIAVALELIKHFEGWEPVPYDDAAKYCTVGFGHLIALASCETLDPLPFAEGISHEAGARLLDSDLRVARLAVLRLVKVELNDAQFGALSSFVFNVGVGNFSRSTLLKRINAMQFDLAAKEFPRWVNAGGKTLRGLKDRRACETGLFLGVVSLGANGEFDRSSCVGLGIAAVASELIDVETGE